MSAAAVTEAGPVGLDIVVEAGEWADEDVLEALAARALGVAAGLSGSAPDDDTPPGPCEVALCFADDARVQDINRTHRGKDKPTNVLSFPAADMPGAPFRFLGDIILAYETVVREAAADGKTFDDHLTHLMVHGFLHLLGYDHETVAEAEEMEALETAILSRLGIADPHAAPLDETP
ncbi:rRNA maturation RNase YbeY [Pseudoxanthobacter sp.]|uniref:rRNA maturation RNase YbeY n=1 Tax=Pseudoxanthobacter sp. TaxID=1925742 RepID=UPI002FE2B5CC